MIRSKLRSNVKKSNSVRKASRIFDREVNKRRSHHGKGRITVYRNEG